MNEYSKKHFEKLSTHYEVGLNHGYHKYSSSILEDAFKYYKKYLTSLYTYGIKE